MEIHFMTSEKKRQMFDRWCCRFFFCLLSCICCVDLRSGIQCVLVEDQRAQFIALGCHRSNKTTREEKQNSCETINFEHVPIPYNLFSPTFFQHTAIVSGVLLESVIISIDFVYNNIIVFAFKSNCTSILYHE